MLTRAAVVTKVKDLATVFAAWYGDRSVPRAKDADGRERPALTYELGQTVFEMLDSLHDSECEQAALPIMELVERFEVEWNRIWGRSREIMPEADQTGGARWQLLWQDMSVEAEKPGIRPPVSPREWQSLGYDNAAIARRMCWYTEPGHMPDIRKVAEELAGVAKHFDPVTWRDPNVERAMKPHREAWERRCQRLAIQADDKPPPPRYDTRTAEEIAIDAPGITAEQIAMRQGRPVAEVRAELHTQGIVLTARGVTYRDVPEGREQRREANCHDECPTLPERMRAMASDGLNSGQIAEALTRHLKMTVTRQKVAKTLSEQEAAA